MTLAAVEVEGQTSDQCIAIKNTSRGSAAVLKNYVLQSQGRVFDRTYVSTPHGQSGHVKVKGKLCLVSK
jgi:hypothetical protein